MENIDNNGEEKAEKVGNCYILPLLNLLKVFWRLTQSMYLNYNMSKYAEFNPCTKKSCWHSMYQI